MEELKDIDHVEQSETAQRSEAAQIKKAVRSQVEIPKPRTKPYTLTFVVGHPSSGKTTKAKEIKDSDPTKYMLISADYLFNRLALMNKPKPVKHFSYLWMRFVYRVIQQVQTYDDFIIDGASLSPEGGVSPYTFFNKASVKLFLEMLPSDVEYQYNIVEVPTSREDCLAYDWERPKEYRHRRNYIWTYHKHPTKDQWPMAQALKRIMEDKKH